MKKITFLLFCFGFALGALQAQPVSQYQFSQASETYVPVTGTLSTATGDDGTQNNIDIGFPFVFGGNTFMTFSISTNGFIRLGDDIGANNWINGLSNTLDQNVIAAFWDDDNRNLGNIVYAVSGTSPDRVLEIGWEGVNIGANGTTNSTVSATFKIRLHETTNQVEIVYGTPMTWVGGVTASIGLNDGSSFVSVTPGSPATASSSVANNAILATDMLPGNKYVFDPPQPCAGLPDPGAALASVSTLCPGQQTVLSLEGNVVQSNLSFQWQSSANGTSYANIADGTTASIIQTPAVNTYYRCIVICNSADGGSAISSPVEVTMNAGCYCIPQYTVGKTDGDLISNVAITGTTLSNNTGTDPVNPSYTYFSGQPNYTATLEIGVPYEIQVTAGSYGQQNSAVWVDYNDDLQFDPTERVGYTTAEVGSFGVASYTILLDCTAPAGLHRMRIRDVWNNAGSLIDPCASYGYGETEDYDITVAPAGCIAPYNLGVTDVSYNSAQLTWSFGCGQSAWDVNVAPVGSGVPTDVVSNPNVSGPLSVSGLEHDVAYEFYVRAHCGNVGLSDWAGPFPFTTGPLPPDNDECTDALQMTVGTNFADNAVIATNSGATTSSDTGTPACASFNFGGDVWFSVVVPATGNVTIEIQADAGSPVTDTGMAVYSGSCGSLTALGCSDDDGIGAFSMMSITGRTPGETLYVRIWEYANDAFGTFKVSAYDAPLGLDVHDTERIAVYPNPVGDVLHISGNKIDTVSIYNMLGQRVLTQTESSGVNSLDVSYLSAGAYLVKAGSAGREQTFKIVKN